MNKAPLVASFFFLAALLYAQDALPNTQPEPLPKAGIRFPAFPAGVQAVSKLTKDLLYVIDSDVPILVLASDDALVTITEEVGPLRIRGRFVDGKAVETKNFKGKQVFIVEALGTGKVVLFVIPQGATKSTDVIRKTLDVEAGEGPRPPPEPPIPLPDDELLKALKAAWLAEVAPERTKLDDLSALFKLFGGTAKNDKSLTTVKQLFDRMQKSRINLIGDGLPKVRAVITLRLDATLPRTLTAPLDEATRDKAAAEFELIGKYLEKLP